VIFPGTFTSIQHFDTDDASGNGTVRKEFWEGVKNIPLLAIAGTCCAIGAIGMIWLWYRWRENYVWLLNRIFL
jgi:hypothetical protein